MGKWELRCSPRTYISGLVLDHQVLKGSEAKDFSKIVKFDQKQHILIVFLALASLKLDGQAPNP